MEDEDIILAVVEDDGRGGNAEALFVLLIADSDAGIHFRLQCIIRVWQHDAHFHDFTGRVQHVHDLIDPAFEGPSRVGQGSHVDIFSLVDKADIGFVYVGLDPDIFQVGDGEETGAVVAADEHIIGRPFLYNESADRRANDIIALVVAAVDLEYPVDPGQFRLGLLDAYPGCQGIGDGGQTTMKQIDGLFQVLLRNGEIGLGIQQIAAVLRHLLAPDDRQHLSCVYIVAQVHFNVGYITGDQGIDGDNIVIIGAYLTGQGDRSDQLAGRDSVYPQGLHHRVGDHIAFIRLGLFLFCLTGLDQ